MTHTERRQQWKARIEAYKASCLSAREFCRQHSITTRQLYYWLRKETLKEQTGNTVQWLPVSLSSKEDIALSDFLTVKVGPAVIEVREGFNEGLLLHVVKVLSALC
ncbi:MAG TPA: helix-turn-helix domain-containing protein [Tissierellaceae bacterium]